LGTEIRSVGVVGLGLMGSGIAQICAMAGLDVVAVEKEQGFLDKGLARIKGSLAKLVEKGKLSVATQELALAKLKSSTRLDDLAACDLVIEAIVEDLGAKNALLKDLGARCKPSTIFASNTSSFPIAAMGVASGRPERMVGLHFFNPVQLMALVEVVRTEQTAADVFDAAKGFAKAVGKQPVIAKDTPGFVVNRLLVPYLGEAIRMLERGDATKEDIDAGMQLGCGHPMGPITLLDYVGLDTTLSILQGWADRFPNDPTFKVPQLLRDMVAKGHLGRKSGRGFYEWEGDKKK
jgi:3-hydroxyacyl-CoA dehydrogenase